MKRLMVILFILLSSSLVFGENYNSRYGETRFNKLPLRGTVSKSIWVGQWWSYSKNGIAYRFQEGYGSTKFSDPDENTKLSPAEKYDKYVKRFDKIDYEKIRKLLEKMDEIAPEINDMIEERRELVYKLNKMIKENDDPDFNWKETEEGKKYLELTKKIEEKQKEIDDLKIDPDTATEWEIMNHGEGVFGVQSWWGHCNAWSAAAVVEPEPVKSFTVEDIEFNVGDMKALLTESWMECQSSFYGSRNDYDKDEEAKKSVDFQDITPAAFHIFFADQIGNKDKSFVIDAYTGSQVWNHPVKSYRFWVEPLYKKDENGNPVPEEVEVKITKYSWGGEGRVESLGKMKVYPIKVKATIHFASDGVDHDEVTKKYDKEIDDETYQDTWRIHTMYSGHFIARNLVYVLYLDKPLEDEDARIIGDGEWKDAAVSGVESHPDFIWQPLANTNNWSREYENPYLDYEIIKNELLPKSLPEYETPEAEEKTYKSEDTPVDIPDNDEENPAVSKIEISDDTTIHSMEVHIKITHTYIADLKIELIAPDEVKRVVLKEKVYYGGYEENLDKTYDVKEFIDMSAKGVWTLKVYDLWAEDTGTLDEWSISIK